ncbi:RloB domain-containing protein [Paenibacillus athensensis]|uniref:Abortive phage infection protein n=1 Tax=Paenibacillus athensensis TaxID=1967502 RepID=A0A4Y8PSZ0_9BACL|nr:RloB domain-containing protein [Paenibacillus athensensis]MCD1261313.1 RloB domain-containing protein [Paenibacillus athensensis]
MTKMKETQRFYFSVEGECEAWYLEALQKLINEEHSAAYKVSFDTKIEKNPYKRAKAMSLLSKREITHWCDYEDGDAENTTKFMHTLDLLKKTSTLGKQIDYKLGYSNFTFELWMVLHKMDCNAAYAHRRQYLQPINRAYGEKFAELKEYKNETNFKRVLGKITLDDVQQAVERARSLMQRHEQNGIKQYEYKGYRYYKDNPSLTVWESVHTILQKCRLV